MSYRILVTGSRDWSDEEAIRTQILEGVWEASGHVVCVVHGGCPTGADAIAGRLAKRLGLDVEVHPADWERYGKAGGPIRNQEMVEAGADKCIAFMLPESRGTRDCVRRARFANIPTVVTHGQSIKST